MKGGRLARFRLIPIPGFQHQNAITGAGEIGGQRSAAGAGTDDDVVVLGPGISARRQRRRGHAAAPGSEPVRKGDRTPQIVQTVLVSGRIQESCPLFGQAQSVFSKSMRSSNSWGVNSMAM